MNPYNNFSYSPYSNYQNQTQSYNNNTNNNTYPYNNNQNQNQSNPYNQNNKNQNFLNPYNFPNTIKNNTNSYSNNQNNQNQNIYNSSLKNNPISMYTNDYYKAKNLINENNYSNNNTNNINYSNNNSNNNLNNNLNNNNIIYDNTKIETWGDFTKYWIFLHHHNYKEGIQNLLKLKKNFFIYMYGSHDSKGISWCSDCRYAEPNINLIKGIIASKEKEKEIYFINIPIDKEKKPFYKNDIILKLSHVPTLIYFENGKEIRRIIQDDMFDKKKVVDFVMKSYQRFY